MFCKKKKKNLKFHFGFLDFRNKTEIKSIETANGHFVSEVKGISLSRYEFCYSSRKLLLKKREIERETVIIPLQRFSIFILYKICS